MARKRLGDICEVVTGSTPKANVKEFWDGDIKWITPAEIDENSYIIIDSVRKITEHAVTKVGLTPFPEGTVILSSRAPIGKVAIAGCEMYCNQGFKNLICFSEINNKYLYWYLRSKTDYLNSLGRGATFKEISKAIVENIELDVPEMQVQQDAVARIQKCDEVLQLRKRELEVLEKLIKSRFVEMFGDPVTNSNGLKAKQMTMLCEIIDGDRGKNYPKAEDFLEEGYCLFLNAKNVTSSGFCFDNCMYISKKKDELLRNGKLQRGDVVLTTRGTLGNLAFYTEEIPYEHMRINSGMVILRMKQDVIDEVFFIEQFKLQLSDIKDKIASGSAQPQLPISTMNKINMLTPEIGKQKEFSIFVNQVDKLKAEIQKSLDETQLLFDSLMQEYFG